METIMNETAQATAGLQKTQPAAGDTIAYHWVMTLQGNDKYGGVASSTCDGTAGFPAGFSREKAFRYCMDRTSAMIAERTPGFAGGPFVVLFFSLEPDRLSL